MQNCHHFSRKGRRGTANASPGLSSPGLLPPACDVCVLDNSVCPRGSVCVRVHETPGVVSYSVQLDGRGCLFTARNMSRDHCVMAYLINTMNFQKQIRERQTKGNSLAREIVSSTSLPKTGLVFRPEALPQVKASDLGGCEPLSLTEGQQDKRAPPGKIILGPSRGRTDTGPVDRVCISPEGGPRLAQAELCHLCYNHHFLQPGSLVSTRCWATFRTIIYKGRAAYV